MRYFCGKNKKRAYFEGWYLKHQKDNKSLALIPAYHIDRHGNPCASIQIITNHISDSVTFPATQFHGDTRRFHVSIGSNSFSSKGMHLNLKSEHFDIKGQLSYGDFTPLRSDIMGPFRFFPFMQCNHGILSLNHTINGNLEINGLHWDFTGGMGYIEKDWGNSFPQSYLWTQCSWSPHCAPHPGTIMVSLAHIPFLNFGFTGCIAVVFYGKREYRFATYKGVKILEYTEKNIILEQGCYLLHVHLLEDFPHPLQAPVGGTMKRTIQESLCCRVRYQFFIHRKKVLDLVSPNASFEYGRPFDATTSTHP